MTIHGHMRRMAAAAAAANQGLSYEDFYTYMSSIAAGFWSGNDQSSGFYNNQIAGVHTLSKSGVMIGTPWGSEYSTNGATLNRVIQHGMPSESVFDQQVSNSSTVFVLTQTFGGSMSLTGINRNGYTSFSSSAPARRRAHNLYYWDFVIKGAFEMRPYTEQGPIPYAW